MSELVSIIVPVYNVEKYLEKCLNSIINQTYKNLEIILVDDGSTDKSGKICDDFAQKDDRIIVYHKENGGVSKARNLGIQKSRGKYIAFCDSDDFIKPNFVEFFVINMEETGADFVCCGFDRLVEDKIINFNIDNKEEYFIERDRAVGEIFYNNQCSGYSVNKFYISSIIKTEPILIFDEDVAILEDELFVLNYIKRCNLFLVSNVPLYVYRDNTQSALHLPLCEKSLTSIIARERIYKYTLENVYSEKLKERAFNDLLKSYAISYKKIILSNIKTKKNWRNKIIKGLKKIKKNHKIDNSWSVKEKIYYIILLFNVMLCK